MQSLSLDLRFAVRQLGNFPGVTAVAVVSLGLGIAALTVMFGILSELLLRSPAGVRAPDEIVRLYIVRNEGVVQTPDGGPGSYLDLRSMQAGLQGVEDIAAFLPIRDYDHGLGAEAQRVRGRPVSGRFFRLLGALPAHGRLLDDNDDRPSDPRHVVILSHAFWQRRFGGDPELIGGSMQLNGKPFTVVGVTEPEFTGIDAEPVDVWTPLGTATEGLYDRADVAIFHFLARIAPAADESLVRASAEASLAAGAADDRTLDPSPVVIVGPLNAAQGPHPDGAVRLALWLWLAAGMLLLIACANISNLLLARAVTRSREFAVRRALGAGQKRIARQVLTESTLLALIGGVFGLGLSILAGGVVRQVPEFQAAAGVGLRLGAFAFLASLIASLLFGLAPAIQPMRIRPDRHQTGRRLPNALVAAQVALTVVLLAGAGIFIRSLQQVITIDTGMSLERLAVASLDLSSAGYADSETAVFYERALERLRALPGIQAASVVMPLPLSGRGWGVGIADRAGGQDVQLPEGPYSYIVGETFFQTAGIRILRGRALTDEDRTVSASVAVVSERLAEALAPGGTALGMCVPVGWEQKQRGDCTRIVGVAADVRHRYLVEEPVPYVYRPDAQLPFHEGPSNFTPNLLVRTEGDPGAHLGRIRSALQGLAPGLPYVKVQTLETLVGDRVIRPLRIAARLLGVFGVLALLMAAVGLYGALSHLVANRAREIGIRMALGATRATVVRLMIRRAMAPVGAGLVTGLVAAAAGARLIDAQMHGLTLRDPITVVLVVVTLIATSLIAAWLPARRAANMDPTLTFRNG